MCSAHQNSQTSAHLMYGNNSAGVGVGGSGGWVGGELDIEIHCK